MTERDELREKCVRAMVDAGNKHKRGHGTSWETMAIAFDSLHGLVRVNPIEATEDMQIAGVEADNNDSHLRGVWRVMSAAGDLTNAPEKRHDFDP